MILCIHQGAALSGRAGRVADFFSSDFSLGHTKTCQSLQTTASFLRGTNPKGGVGAETEGSGAEVPVRWEMLRERESKSLGAGLLRAKQSREIAARRRKVGYCLKGLTRFCTT